jgi:hypothetical protein
MARGVRLPRTTGRPPRFLRTGHRRAASLSEAHLQAAQRDARHTLRREAQGSIAFVPSGIAGPASAKGDIPRPGRPRPRRRRGARFRGELLAAAEVADAAPATAPRPEAPCCAAAALPRLSDSSSADVAAHARQRRCSPPGPSTDVARVSLFVSGECEAPPRLQDRRSEQARSNPAYARTVSRVAATSVTGLSLGRAKRSSHR